MAHASHELRTPLALLRTELELAVRRPRPAGDLVEAIDSARDEVARLQRLAEDLLLLAQVGEGRLPVHAEDLSAAAVLEDVRALFETTAARAGRSVTVGAVAGSVRGDPAQVRQALTNLVDNALQHGGGVVGLSARPDGDRLVLVVTDQGGGFEEDLLGRAAERFVRSAGSTGAGLGLAIVAAVADAHDGTAGVANLAGGGAEAWLALPAVPVAAGEPVGA